MELLGRGALLLALLAAVYAPIAAIVGRAHARPAARHERAARARRLLRLRRGRLGRARDGHRAPRLPLRERRRALLARGAAAVSDLVVLVEPGGLAAALAARPQRSLGARHLPAPPPLARADAVSGGVPGRRLRVLRVRDELRGQSVRDRRPGAARRRRARAVAAEPVHAHAPAAALPRLRRLHDPVRVRDGGARQRPHRRALAAGRAALDARALARARRRACCWAPSGPTRRSAGAGSGAGIRSRTRR